MIMVSRILVLGASAIAVAAIGVSSFVSFTPKLVWNGSASAAVGHYRIEQRDPNLGDYVLVKPDERLAEFIAERLYLPPEIPLLKRIAALPGDEICREHARIFINKIAAAEALVTDSMGRNMPQWSGCFTLRSGEVFLLNASKRSLDGRYFGATKRSEIIGVAIPVWTRTHKEHWPPDSRVESDGAYAKEILK